MNLPLHKWISMALNLRLCTQIPILREYLLFSVGHMYDSLIVWVSNLIYLSDHIGNIYISANNFYNNILVRAAAATMATLNSRLLRGQHSCACIERLFRGGWERASLCLFFANHASIPWSWDLWLYLAWYQELVIVLWVTSSHHRLTFTEPIGGASTSF